MPVTNYFSANGMLIGEQTNGVNIDYVPDALGSIVAAVDENLSMTYTAAYAPYGTVLASTGTAPNFTWVGNLGYLPGAGRPYAEYSVRTRILSKKTGGWNAIDALWPTERAYSYVGGNPVSRVDPSGRSCSCADGDVSWSSTTWTTGGLKPVPPPPTAGNCGTLAVTVSGSGSVSVNGGVVGITLGGGISGTQTCSCTQTNYSGTFVRTVTSCDCDWVYYSPPRGDPVWRCLSCAETSKTIKCSGKIYVQVLNCLGWPPIIATVISGCGVSGTVWSHG